MSITALTAQLQRERGLSWTEARDAAALILRQQASSGNG
jgi:hypothetical protein